MIGLVLAGVVAASHLAADPRIERMATLFDEVCLRAFPDDAAVTAVMTARGARPLTDEQARVTLVDDPGRGWEISDQGRTVLVFLEQPPFHACSVRFPIRADAPGNAPYRAVAEPFEATHPGFTPVAPLDRDAGAIHVHAFGDGRRLANGGSETLLVFDQTITDPAQRARGQTGVMRRFVHQIVAPR